MHVPELDSDVAAPALARLYNHPSYEDPWQAVLDHRRVIEYQAENPNAGRHAVGTALELPPSRVRGWLDDMVPDPARGVNSAIERGWFDLDFEAQRFRGLNVLVAWIFSGGSITQRHWVPYFAVTDTPDPLLDRAADAANVDLSLAREAEAGRTAEYRPGADASVLGRVLHLLGAPVGAKHTDARIRLPSYLRAAPALVRREFVATYLYNRGVQHGDAAVLGLREERPPAYLDALADFFAAVIGAPVRRTEYNLNLSTEATEIVREWALPLEDQVGRLSEVATIIRESAARIDVDPT